MGASFSSFGCFVVEFWVIRFRVLGDSFSSFGCFVFEFWLLRFRDLGASWTVVRSSFSSASFSKLPRSNHQIHGKKKILPIDIQKAFRRTIRTLEPLYKELFSRNNKSTAFYVSKEVKENARSQQKINLVGQEQSHRKQ